MPTLRSDATCSLDMSAYPGYYEDGRYDNTPATYLTNYVLALTGCAYSLLLWRHRKCHAALEHTRPWFCVKLVLTAISVTLAGFVHQGLFGTSGDVLHSAANKSLWFAVESLMILSGGCGICAAIAAVTIVDATRRNVTAYVATAMLSSLLIISLAMFIGMDFFVVAGLFGDILANTVLVVCVLLWGCRHASSDEQAGLLKSKMALALALLLSFLGDYVQVALGDVCGMPCPVDCPLPAPAFNHNAAFHVAQMAAQACLAFGMHKACLCLEEQALRDQKQPLSSDLESSLPSICDESLEPGIVLKPKEAAPKLPRTMALAAAAGQQLVKEEKQHKEHSTLSTLASEHMTLSTLASSAPSQGPSRSSLVRSLTRFVATQSEASSTITSNTSSRTSSLLTSSAPSRASSRSSNASSLLGPQRKHRSHGLFSFLAAADIAAAAEQLSETRGGESFTPSRPSEVIVVLKADGDEHEYSWEFRHVLALTTPIREAASAWALAHHVPAECVGLEDEDGKLLGLERTPAQLGWSNGRCIILHAVPLDDEFQGT